MSALLEVREFYRIHEDCEGRPVLLSSDVLEIGGEAVAVTLHCEDCGAKEEIHVAPDEASAVMDLLLADWL